MAVQVGVKCVIRAMFSAITAANYFCLVSFTHWIHGKLFPRGTWERIARKLNTPTITPNLEKLQKKQSEVKTVKAITSVVPTVERVESFEIFRVKVRITFGCSGHPLSIYFPPAKLFSCILANIFRYFLI